MIDKHARWIWIDHEAKKNEYAVFEGDFTASGKPLLFSLCAETDYVLRINGEVASFGQFAGYPHQKYYDTVDITALCRPGKNRYSLSVRYEGVDSATHIDDGPGVIFSLQDGEQTILVSGTSTASGYDTRYVQHEARSITVQLGLSSAMRCGEAPSLAPCVELEKQARLLPRPVKKLAVSSFLQATPVPGKKNVYDLGREEAGYLRVTFRAEAPGLATVAYGEHLADRCVRRRVGGRDFSLDFALTPGEHTFTQYYIRIAGRYLEVSLPEGAVVTDIGILPALYPVTEKEFPLADEDQRIYDTCVRTLRLCMGNHYEDCPWREQGLYVLDARNQMLCGYYVFEESDYARANLVFMAEGTREDGLLELTYPAVRTPAIPFFSLMYPVAVAEYVAHAGDASILQEVGQVVDTILHVFADKVDGTGLIPELGPPYWNFYEWSEGSDGLGRDRREGQHALLLNCAFVYSVHQYASVAPSFDGELLSKAAEIKSAIAKIFALEDGRFRLFDTGELRVSQLGNAMAMLIGLGDKQTENAVKCGENDIPATLSTMGFVYDALLKRDASNGEYVLNDIRQKYNSMLDRGATSFWETLEGQSAFDNAGSLCHGWSALPAYYYHRLFNRSAEKTE